MGLWKWIYSFFRWKQSNFSPIGALNFVKTHPNKFQVMTTPEFEKVFLNIANKMFRLKTDAPLHERDIQNIIELTRRKLKLFTPQESFEYVLSLKEYHDAFEPIDLKEIRKPFLKQATLSQGLNKDQAKELMVKILASRKTTITPAENYKAKQLEKLSTFIEERLTQFLREVQKLKKEFAPDKERNPIRLEQIRQSNQRLKIISQALAERTSDASKTWPSLKAPLQKEITQWTALISDINTFINKPYTQESKIQFRGRLLSFEADLINSSNKIRQKIAIEKAA